MVIGTSGVGFVVDAWKVTKVVGIRGQEKEKPSKNEELTNEIDAQVIMLTLIFFFLHFQQTCWIHCFVTNSLFEMKGMYYLSLILYPCVFFWALYSLYTRTHKRSIPLFKK